jgi:hypothetical protein
MTQKYIAVAHASRTCRDSQHFQVHQGPITPTKNPGIHAKVWPSYNVTTGTSNCFSRENQHDERGEKLSSEKFKPAKLACR